MTHGVTIAKKVGEATWSGPFFLAVTHEGINRQWWREERGRGWGGVGGRDRLSRTVKGAVPVGGDLPEEGPPSDHLKISPI